MVPSEGSNQPASGREGRVPGAVARRPMAWIVATGLALFLSGVFFVVVSFWSTPTSSWQTTGLLLIALGMFVVGAIRPALETFGFPWPATFRRTTEERFKHPRLVGAAQVWFCVVVLGWVIVMILDQAPDHPLSPIIFAAPLVGLVPLYAVVFSDRRR